MTNQNETPFGETGNTPSDYIHVLKEIHRLIGLVYVTGLIDGRKQAKEKEGIERSIKKGKKKRGEIDRELEEWVECFSSIRAHIFIWEERLKRVNSTEFTNPCLYAAECMRHIRDELKRFDED